MGNIEQLSEDMVATAAILAMPMVTTITACDPVKEEPQLEEGVEEEEVVEEDIEELEVALFSTKETESEEESRRSKDVDQLLEAIRDPELDSSLEDIAAMIESRDQETPKQEDKLRVSPEFAQAAGLIDKNPDQGFDPEDPAVKGLENWECTNNMDDVDSSLDNLRTNSRKLKNNVIKRLSKAEERKSLIDPDGAGDDKKSIEGKEEAGCGCFTSWLVYI